MAEPNIISVSSIYGRTRTATLSTSAAQIYPCPQNKVAKLNSIIVSNRSGSSSADASVYFWDNSRGTAVYLVFTVPVMADSALIVLSKESPLYLEEFDRIEALASVNNTLDILVSFEEIG